MARYDDRNGYMLQGELAVRGYDWWWHSIVAKNDATGELEPFFIEYFIINPEEGGYDVPILGQLPENKKMNRKPSYGMIKAGKWGNSKAQIHTFHPLKNCSAKKSKMDVQIGTNVANDNCLKGRVYVSAETAIAHPEYMTDAGDMSWDLQILNKNSYSVGYGTSWLLRKLNLFQMFWHVQGMETAYSGKIVYNGNTYSVSPEIALGYQDKNWGTDYTNPWIWLNCNKFTDENGVCLHGTSLDLGGGRPRVAGISLGKKILVAFRHKSILYEFNFTKQLSYEQSWQCRIDDNFVYWDVIVENRKYQLTIRFKCPLETMILVKYENPDGMQNHKQLYNGGYASGTVEIYKKYLNGKVLIEKVYGDMGGCEFGEY
jgi:hypothetical protein